MKAQYSIKKINLNNLETKRILEKQRKENKEKISNKEKRTNNKQSTNILEKKSFRMDGSLTGNNLIKNLKMNNNTNNPNKGKHQIQINCRTLQNNERNSIIKKITTSKNLNNKNNNKINEKNKEKWNTLNEENPIIIYDDKNNNKTIDIYENKINTDKNDCKFAINNNILYLINSNNKNLIIDEKMHVRKNNSSTKIFSSPNEELNILNYGSMNNNNIYYINNNNNKKDMLNNLENRNNGIINITKDNGNFVYKKTERNNSCFKRRKYYKSKLFEFENYLKSPPEPHNQSKRNNFQEVENLLLPINDDYNRKVNNNNKYYLYKKTKNDINKSLININYKTYLIENNDEVKTIDYYNIGKNRKYTTYGIYNKIRNRGMINTSMRKRKTLNSFFLSDIDYKKTNIDESEINNNNQTMIVNKKDKFNNFKNYKNQCTLNINDNFNKTTLLLYKNKKKGIEPLESSNFIYENDKNLKKTEKYFDNDNKTIDNIFYKKNKCETSKIKTKDFALDLTSNYFYSKIPKNSNIINIPNGNKKIYQKKNIYDKTSDLSTKTKTLKKEKYISFSINTENINYTNNIDKTMKNENEITNTEIDSSFLENLNEKVINKFHCFQKKKYNYFIKNQIKKGYYLDKIKFYKNQKNKLDNYSQKNISDSESKNLQYISDIENKTLSLKNISKDYSNFELYEIDDKKNSIDNDKLSSFEKISLGAKKLNEIFIKKNEPEINKIVRRTMTQENFVLGYSKLKDVINNKINCSDINNSQIDKKIYTYKIQKKNQLFEEEDYENLKMDKILSNKNEQNVDINNNKIIYEGDNNSKQNLKMNNTNEVVFNENKNMKNDENQMKNGELQKNKSKKKSKSTEKRCITKLLRGEKKESKIYKKENDNIEINQDIILKDFQNYIKYLEKENIKNKEDIYEGINDSYDWKIIDELITKKNIKIDDIIKIYINICKNNNFINNNTIFKANEYIKSIIEYYTNNLSKNQKEIIHLNMIEEFNNINNILNNSNEYIFEILGNLLFILLKNKLYYMKDLNNFIDKDKNTQINIAKIVKFAILASGNLSKQYHNDFKYTKLFNNNDIFINYITREIYGNNNK